MKTRARERTVLAGEWCAWIAENLVTGSEPKELVRELVASGVSRALAQRAVEEIRVSPALHAVQALLHTSERLELHAKLIATFEDTRSAPIERRRKPGADEFFERYWAGNRPVVFTDATKGWKLWTPKDMKRLLGNVTIEVTEGREADPYYDEHTPLHSKKTTMGAYVDRVLAAGETNDIYMVANNKTMDRPEMKRLLDRIVIDDTFFDPKRIPGGTSLWLGPKGTVTPLHHDTTNIFFTQIYGRKKFLLAPPHVFELGAAARGFYIDLDPELPPKKRPSWARKIHFHEVVLERGEVLFLPAGWWHHVRALDVSISLSLLNFRRPNSFAWYRPGFVSPRGRVGDQEVTGS